MTLVRISTQASAQAAGAGLGMAVCLAVLAFGGLPDALTGLLVGGLAVAGPLGAAIAARGFRGIDQARPAPPDSAWDNGRLRGPARILVAPALYAAFLGLTSTAGASPWYSEASGLLLVLTGLLAMKTTEAILAAYVERRDDVVVLELRGWWGREASVLYTAPPPSAASPTTEPA